MGICDVELPDGSRCPKETVWMDMCEDHLQQFENEMTLPPKPAVSGTRYTLINHEYLKMYVDKDQDGSMEVFISNNIGQEDINATWPITRDELIRVARNILECVG